MPEVVIPKKIVYKEIPIKTEAVKEAEKVIEAAGEKVVKDDSAAAAPAPSAPQQDALSPKSDAAAASSELGVAMQNKTAAIAQRDANRKEELQAAAAKV